MKRNLLAAVLALGLFTGIGMFASTQADAKKPVTQQVTASITLNGTDVHLGDSVTFTYVVPSTVSSPRIQVMCTQNGVLVYGEAGPADQAFLLGGGMSQWLMNGGPAYCTATVYEWDWHPVQTFAPYASTTFTAGGK